MIRRKRKIRTREAKDLALLISADPLHLIATRRKRRSPPAPAAEIAAIVETVEEESETRARRDQRIDIEDLVRAHTPHQAAPTKTQVTLGSNSTG